MVNDPVNFFDSTGKVIDTAADFAFIAFDIQQIIAANAAGDCDALNTNLQALGADVFGALVPGVTGLGLAVRGVKGASRVTKLSSAESPIWRGLKGFRGEIKTNGKTGKDKRFYKWDNTHGDIEVFNRNGQHLGTASPTTGKIIKPTVPGRTIKVK